MPIVVAIFIGHPEIPSVVSACVKVCWWKGKPVATIRYSYVVLLLLNEKIVLFGLPRGCQLDIRLGTGGDSLRYCSNRGPLSCFTSFRHFHSATQIHIVLSSVSCYIVSWINMQSPSFIRVCFPVRGISVNVPTGRVYCSRDTYSSIILYDCILTRCVIAIPYVLIGLADFIACRKDILWHLPIESC